MLSLQGKKALIVDDDVGFRSLLRGAIENFGLSAWETSSSEEALIALQKVTPDLILLDIGMPKQSGLEFLERKARIRSLSGIPTIVVSGDASRRTHFTAFSLGAKDYIVKPLN